MRYGLRVMGRTGTEYYTNHVWNNYNAAGFRVSAHIDLYSPYHNSAFDISLNKKTIVREISSSKYAHKIVHRSHWKAICNVLTRAPFRVSLTWAAGTMRAFVIFEVEILQ